MGGVVDQDRDRPVDGGRVGDGGAKRFDVAKIAGDEQRCRLSVRFDFGHQDLARLFGDVHEGDLRFLRCKVPDDRGADAGAAARDEHRASFKTGVDGAHASSSCSMPAGSCHAVTPSQ